MASDKFGNNPVAPLYNATGRNPRDLEMGSIGKPLGSVGNSGGGGKDFGTPGKAPQLLGLGTDYMSPLSLYGPNSMYRNATSTQGGGKWGRGRRGGGGGGGGGPTDADGREIDLEASLALTKAATPGTVSFGDQAGGHQANVGSRAQQGEGSQISGKNSAFNDVNDGNTLTSTVQSTPEPAKQSRAPRTAAQKQATAATRAEKKAANPAYGRRGTTPRPERGESPIARRKSAPAPAAPTTVTNEQSIGNLKQKSTIGGML